MNVVLAEDVKTRPDEEDAAAVGVSDDEPAAVVANVVPEDAGGVLRDMVGTVLAGLDDVIGAVEVGTSDEDETSGGEEVELAISLDEEEGIGPENPPTGELGGETLLELTFSAADWKAANVSLDYSLAWPQKEREKGKERYTWIKSKHHPSLAVRVDGTVKESRRRISDSNYEIWLWANS